MSRIINTAIICDNCGHKDTTEKEVWKDSLPDLTTSISTATLIMASTIILGPRASTKDYCSKCVAAVYVAIKDSLAKRKQEERESNGNS